MNWLNLNLSTLRTPAYMGSEPTERATWLQVLAYCVDQENGGVIPGGALWKDRQWQQTCGVTVEELRAAGKLIVIEGDDVRVLFYPLDKEAEVKQRRIAGQEAANRRWHGKLKGENSAVKNAPDSLVAEEEPLTKTRTHDVQQTSGENRDAAPIANANAETHARPSGSFFAPRNAEGEFEEERERNVPSPASSPVDAEDRTGRSGKQERESGPGAGVVGKPRPHDAVQTPPSWPEALAYAGKIGLAEWKARDWFDEMTGCGWLDFRHRPICDWRAVLRRVCAKWMVDGSPGVQPGHAIAAPGAPGAASSGHTARPLSTLDIHTRLRAIDDELALLRRHAPEGRSADGLRTVKIYTPAQETRRKELRTARDALKRQLTAV